MSRLFPSPAFALLAVLSLALLALLPTGSVQAQQDSAPVGITAGPVITSNPEIGDAYGKREEIVVAVTFSEPVTVTGEPRVRLTVGDRKRWARYERSDQDGARLIFTYVVKANDLDDDGISIGKNKIDVNGGKIKDADGNRAQLRHRPLTDQPGHRVNGSPASEPEPTPEPTPMPTPNNEPQFAADSATRSVAENSLPGVYVGDPVTATDDDDDALTIPSAAAMRSSRLPQPARYSSQRARASTTRPRTSTR
ncbi:MAG: hypothetical protein OXE02_06765 [Chloroflexi bacterium]|nr:hypothetical protein [Chloroflexota bacterium]